MANADPNALLTGASWAPTPGTPQVVTYSFAQDGAGGIGPALAPGEWAPFSAAEQASTRLALAAWAADCGVTFVEVPDDAAGAGIDLRFRLENLGSVGELGFAYGPPFGNVALDLGLFAGDSLAPDPHRVGFTVLLHEIGHALGLKHPWEGDVTLPPALDTPQETVMAYVGASAFLPQAPQPLDAAAVQLLYGAPGSGTVSWSYDAADHAVLGQGSAGNDLFSAPSYGAIMVGGGGNDTFLGGGGVDTAVFACAHDQAVVNLGAGTVTTPTGTSVVRNIAALAFTDGHLAIGENDPAAVIADLYVAALGRAPDPAGLVTWLGLVQAGGSLEQVAERILRSPEFHQKFGALDDAGFAALLGAHGADAAAAQAREDAGWDRAQVLLAATQDDPVRAVTNGLLDHGLWVPMGTGEAVARLYHIALGRAPDALGWANWFTAVAHGESLDQVAGTFANCAEAQALGAALPDWLAHGLGHAPDAATLAHWQALAASEDAGHLLAALAEDPGVAAALKPVTEPGILFA